jgi:hypothetical protein
MYSGANCNAPAGVTNAPLLAHECARLRCAVKCTHGHTGTLAHTHLANAIMSRKMNCNCCAEDRTSAAAAAAGGGEDAEADSGVDSTKAGFESEAPGSAFATAAAIAYTRACKRTMLSDRHARPARHISPSMHHHNHGVISNVW